VAAGESLLSPLATRTVISRFLAAPAPGGPAATPGDLAALTAREREVMAWVAEGHSNEEIAGRLVASPQTVRTHVHSAMTKLGARDRAQLVAIAYQSGLMQVAPPSRLSPPPGSPATAGADPTPPR
jgi:DNA-binding CsgD family transcriptional regulator